MHENRGTVTTNTLNWRSTDLSSSCLFPTSVFVLTVLQATFHSTRYIVDIHTVSYQTKISLHSRTKTKVSQSRKRITHAPASSGTWKIYEKCVTDKRKSYYLLTDGHIYIQSNGGCNHTSPNYRFLIIFRNTLLSVTEYYMLFTWRLMTNMKMISRASAEHLITASIPFVDLVRKQA